jgi:hypothetical protein
MAELGNPLSIPRALRLFQRRRLPANCLAADVVGNTVYITGDKVGKYYQVATTDPLTPAKMPAMGIIIQKGSPTQCIVAPFGEIEGIYTGFTAGEALYVGLDSRPTHAKPDPPAIPQYIGDAFDSDLLFFWPAAGGSGGGGSRLYGRPLNGTKDGSNRDFTTDEKFLPDSIKVYHCGRTLIRSTVPMPTGGEYYVSESGGAGTGYDTVSFLSFIPVEQSEILADYDVSV